MFLLAVLAASGPFAHAAPPPIYVAEVEDLFNPEATLETLGQRGALELSVEALAHYRAGLDACSREDPKRAAELFAIAADLDTAFPEPHIALARVDLLRQPASVPGHLFRAARAGVRSFGAQHLILVNSLLGILLAAAVGSFLVATYAALRLLPHVAHSVTELGRRWFPSIVALLLTTILFSVPFLWQVGLVPVVLLLSGLMWNWMHKVERRWVIVLGALILASVPALWVLSPVVYTPLDPSERPVLMSRAMVAPHSRGLVQAIEEGLERHPGDPSLQFSLGLLEKRGGHLERAASLYESALEAGAPAAEVYNNLGVVAFQQEDIDGSIQYLTQAIAENPDLAAAHFNLSQAYAKKLYFERSDDSMREANRLSFNRVRSELRHQAGTGRTALIDERLPASAYWAVSLSGPRRAPEIPLWMQIWFPGRFVALPPIAVLLFAIGSVLGNRLHRTLPSFACTNCGRAVCRRCLRRIRRSAYCTPCGDALLRIQSAAYSKLVLNSRLRRGRPLPALLTQAGDWLLPGYRAVRIGRVNVGAFLALVSGLAVISLIRPEIPLTRLAWLEEGPGPWWPELPLAVFLVAFVISGITILKLRPEPTAQGLDESDPRHSEEGLLPPVGKAA